MRTTLRRRATGLGLALLLGGLAACSSAPLPKDELAQGGELPSGTVIDPDTGQVVDAETGEVVDPVTGEAVAEGQTGTPGAVDPAAPGAVTGPSQTSSGGAAPGAPAPGGAPQPGEAAPARSTLFTAAEEKIGITDAQITLCAHAALTYGPAFNVTDDDLNVFWSATNDAGGVHGRRVVVSYENDDYKADRAVTAATACKGRNIFMLLGGIGFDQIPAVRNWAERNRMLYMHHTATVKGTAGQRFSFAPLPTVERTGEAFGQLYMSKYSGKKVGIIKRDGENWEPGVDAFKAYLGASAKFVVAESKVPQNKGNYTEDILKMKNAGAEVVWIWENALGATQVVKQIKAQNYKPNMMLFPFNLTAQTLDDDAMDPPLDGVAMFTAYSKGDYSGSFASYADDIKLFEAQYRKYRPNVDLGGVGGDLLFLNWTAQKALYHQLMDCGKDCNRNRFVDVLESYRKRPTSSVCPIDFTKGSRRLGSDKLMFMETYRAPGGKVNWRNTKSCVGSD